MHLATESSRWLALGLGNIPFYLALGKLMFGDWAGFFESVRFWFTPDVISMMMGEYLEDRWASLKLLVFIACCALVVYGEYRFFWGNPLH